VGVGKFNHIIIVLIPFLEMGVAKFYTKIKLKRGYISVRVFLESCKKFLPLVLY